MTDGLLLGTHEAVLRGLWSAARSDRLPHALLFHGPAGIGKYAAARRLVAGLACARAQAEGPCGTCGPCKRLASGNHLDLLLIDVAHEDVPDDRREERIKLDRIVRRPAPAWSGPVVEEFLGLRAAEGGWRAVLVRDAERLRHSQNEAQNALLKMLEEPGRDVLWVLVSAHPEALLATVRSRCAAVRFDPLRQDEVLAVLSGQGLGAEESRRLARWARGSPGAALALRARGALAFRPLLEQVLTGRQAPLAAARQAWQVEGQFSGRTPTARAREQARALVELALDVTGDLLRLACGAPGESLAHGDLAGRADLPAEHVLRLAVDELLEARADLERNLDPQVVVDLALCALAARGALVGRGS